MRRAGAVVLAVGASLMLAACFLLPGKFSSTLDLRRDGAFDFTYKGEIVLLAPPGTGGPGPVMKDNPAAPCFGPAPGSASALTPPPAIQDVSPQPMIITPPVRLTQRVCTTDERTKRTADVNAANARFASDRKRESEQLAKIIGMDPADEESMRAYAAAVSNQAGWKSVIYRGNGVFDVDFAQSGHLDRDFVFPVLPRSTVVVPFVVIRKRADGAVLVAAPGYRADPGQALFNGFNGVRAQSRPAANSPQGSFVLTSDVAPLTNNTDDGPAHNGQRSRLTWTVMPGSDKVPEALIPIGR